MRIALAQINPVVGDLKGNARKILDYAQRAHALAADLVVFPELCTVGYPPQDLVEIPRFVEDERAARAWIASAAPAKIGLILGGLARNQAGGGKRLYNAAFLYEGGRKTAEVYKSLLPTYDVFDERRHFEPAAERRVVAWRGKRLGIHICEDLWNSIGSDHARYPVNPIADLAARGADLFINICASPYAVGKEADREQLIVHSCRAHGIPYVFVNQVGANTELIFDGASGVYASDGSCVVCAPVFREALCVWDMDNDIAACAQRPDAMESLHSALVVGIHDYFHKTGAFTKAIVGLSGGIDSAVTCALAVEALGPDKVAGVTMPSVYSSPGSVNDARALADNLGIEFQTIPIRGPVAAFEASLSQAFQGTDPGVAEENIQARARGVLLMALSNKFAYLLLSTGNKSELAVGYATLYGDMNGGLAVLGDVVKTQVYRLARYINARKSCIPESTLTKAPSAELRPNQADQDSLPPYEDLDEILRRYVEQREELADIVNATDLDYGMVEDILRRIDRNEYKRRQAPPCLRVTQKAFGQGRRLPIVMRRERHPES